MDYKTVFEVTDKGFEMITQMPLLFVVVGVGISWINIKYNKSTSPKRMSAIVFGFIFSGFALITLLLTVPSGIKERNKTREIFEKKEYQVVAGKIENFHPMPPGGHDVESFDVNGGKDTIPYISAGKLIRNL